MVTKNPRSKALVPILQAKHYGANLAAEDDFEVDLLVKGRSDMMKRTCPGGVDRCHCLNKPGTFSEGPFDFDEDPIQGGNSLDFLSARVLT